MLKAISKSYAPIEIIISDRQTERELYSLLLQSFDSIEILKLKGKNLDSVKQKISDSLKIGYYFGHPEIIKPDLNHPYTLPFRKNKAYEVSQGFNGKTSHNHIASRYAIDFQLNVGEPIYAARSGTVVKVIDWFSKQGGPELKNAANKILILHKDGTIGNYAHLDYKGSLVREGMYVEAGQKIGISGLTGYTNGPHLHFVVRKERDIAIPIQFEGYENRNLKKGKHYIRKL
ncbi:M23 family metallopeptidase [Mangrovimonas sp. TPBH4]|uniref:M23 family metallopeptidase n=1 Tax=Mangrovimonas sp. TPBH4 TaxID=1645914 RepID=UPI0018D065A2|nr:M23 family metallopeptidase [Mangrovimonas sp. TPBH4]